MLKSLFSTVRLNRKQNIPLGTIPISPTIQLVPTLRRPTPFSWGLFNYPYHTYTLLDDVPNQATQIIGTNATWFNILHSLVVMWPNTILIDPLSYGLVLYSAHLLWLRSILYHWSSLIAIDLHADHCLGDGRLITSSTYMWAVYHLVHLHLVTMYSRWSSDKLKIASINILHLACQITRARCLAPCFRF